MQGGDVLLLRCRRAEGIVRKGVEGRIARQHAQHGSVEFGEEALEIDEGRRALDLPALVMDLKHAGVAGGAGQAR